MDRRAFDDEGGKLMILASNKKAPDWFGAMTIVVDVRFYRANQLLPSLITVFDP
jgi:hypothetical protein